MYVKASTNNVIIFIGNVIMSFTSHRLIILTLKEKLEDIKVVIRIVNRGGQTMHAMVKRKRLKGQTIIYKTLHRKLKIK
jgi:hypothetical protein